MGTSKERRAHLNRLSTLRFGKVEYTEEELNNIGAKDPKLEIPKFNWDTYCKPPLSFYLSSNVAKEVMRITREPTLMNNPKKKFELVNKEMASIGFVPLASGTNRRAFRCLYDDSIIIKIGSDRVGRGDNIAEYYSQHKIKPFCCKVFDVDQSGTFALIERVETMTAKEFKQRWRSEIFDILMSLVYRGYVCEDVGGNFYRNWAIREGFGPVMIDFPYVYEIEWGKLRCIHKDPLTGIQCGGDLDYDYSKGMSEIICERCGTRYSATYLGKLFNISRNDDLLNGRMFKMANTGFTVSIRRGNEVIYRSYTEEENEQIVRTESTTKSSTIKSSVVRRDNGTKIDTSISNSKDLTTEDLGKILDLVYDNFGIKTTINLAKRLGVFYKDPSIRGDNPAITQRRESKRIEEPKQEVKLDRISDIITSSPQKSDDNRATSGLRIVKPKTSEEIEQEERNKRDSGDLVYGIPAEPLTQTLKLKNSIPKLKNLLIERFDHKLDIDGTDGLTLTSQLSEDIKNLLSIPIADLTNTDVGGLEVNVMLTTDQENKPCFIVTVEHYKSPILDVCLYAKSKQKNNSETRTIDITPTTEEVQKDDKDEITKFLDEKFLFLDNQYRDLKNTNAYTTAIHFGLICEVQKKYQKYSYDEACEVVHRYITGDNNNESISIEENL